MKDARREIRAIFQEMVMTVEPGDRVNLSFQLHDLARQRIRESVLRKNPEATEVEIQQQIFLRFYERDYTESQRNHILALIEQRFSNTSAPDAAH